MNEISGNKETLINTALNLFSARGYDAVGVQEIAEKAGVTKPTLYHYFGSKHGLLDFILDTCFNQLFENLTPAAGYAGDLPLTLTRTAEVYFRFAEKHPRFYRMQIAMWFSGPESESHQALTKYILQQHKVFEQVFMPASDDHGNMKGRHQAYSATFLGMLNTYIGMYLNGYILLDDEIMYRAVHQYMHGIFS